MTATDREMVMAELSVDLDLAESKLALLESLNESKSDKIEPWQELMYASISSPEVRDYLVVKRVRELISSRGKHDK